MAIKFERDEKGNVIAIDTETGKKSEVYRLWAISLKETKKSKHKKKSRQEVLLALFRKWRTKPCHL